MNLVDSSAWLAYFADEKNADYFKDAIEDIEGLIVPTICLHEVFKVVLRSRGEDEALAVLATMQQGVVVPLDESLAIEAAAVGIEHKLATADSIIYATAQRHGAVVWTQDEHFSKLPNVRFRKKSK
jgi:toxin FitB